ncbi:hypothetical protein [Halalkalibacillus halophilus]|uniref:hypothetical protein n=1 Tax=Halalkalibacillus halophilus TaxID=392827 RepID=UPI000482EC7A|nr:hypothetical protein [Halalkalibacillus halophilus]
MKITNHNHHLEVGSIDVTGVSSSSLLLIGDSEHLQFASTFDSPPESYVIENVIPFANVSG